MSKVSIKVGPKTYTFTTAEGEEAKITALGELIDGKYQMLGHSRSVQETDNLVFAALFLADELEETRKTIADARIAAESAQREAEAARSEAVKLREEEANARDEAQALKTEIARLQQSAQQQNELFVADPTDDTLAERIEALASRAEEIAAALESTGADDDGLEGGEAAD